MTSFHKALALVTLSLHLKHKKARASVSLKNGLGSTPCGAQQLGLRAFWNLGAPRVDFLNIDIVLEDRKIIPSTHGLRKKNNAKIHLAMAN